MGLRFSSLILVAGMAISTFALASSGGVRFDDVRNQQAEIRAGVMARSGRYRDLPDNTRSEILNRQTRLLNTIDGKQAPDELNQEERLAVFNDLEWIEATINSAKEENLVCEYTKTIGSNRKQRICRTAEQVREARERARNEFDKSGPRMLKGS